MYWAVGGYPFSQDISEVGYQRKELRGLLLLPDFRLLKVVVQFFGGGFPPASRNLGGGKACLSEELHAPAAVKRVLRKLGEDIHDARRRRHLPMAVVAERAFTSRSTLQRIEAGNPNVSMGIYAGVLQFQKLPRL